MNLKKINTAKVIIFISAWIIFFALTAERSGGETITVDDDGGEDYTKIQDAINSSTPGDTVYIKNGTYLENILVDKTINLTGENKNNTTIKADERIIIKITTDWCNLSKFRIIGKYRYSIGIKVFSNNVNISNVISKSNKIGISLEPFSENCTLLNNSLSSNADAGVSLSTSSNNSLIANTCFNNNDGISLLNSDLNKVFFNNCSENYRGLMAWQSNNNIIKANTFCFNNYDGIVLRTEVNSTLADNNCTGNKNGIKLDNSSFNHIYNNRCSQNNKSGIVFYRGICSFNNISSNSCSQNWAGIEIRFVKNNNILNNILADNEYFGIYEICHSHRPEHNNIHDNVFLGNGNSHEIVKVEEHHGDDPLEKLDSKKDLLFEFISSIWTGLFILLVLAVVTLKRIFKRNL